MKSGKYLTSHLADGLKAAEMLARMCGWNEPEAVQHSHVHLQIDGALADQLRAGYAELNARRTSQPKQLTESVAGNGEATTA